MKNYKLIFSLVLTLTSAKAFAEDRKYITCQTPSIIYGAKEFVFMNNKDGLIPDPADLHQGSKNIGLYYTVPNMPAQVVSDGEVEIKNVVNVQPDLVAVQYSIKTTSTPLTRDTYGEMGGAGHKASGWILCGSFLY